MEWTDLIDFADFISLAIYIYLLFFSCSLSEFPVFFYGPGVSRICVAGEGRSGLGHCTVCIDSLCSRICTHGLTCDISLFMLLYLLSSHEVCVLSFSSDGGVSDLVCAWVERTHCSVRGWVGGWLSCLRKVVMNDVLSRWIGSIQGRVMSRREREREREGDLRASLLCSLSPEARLGSVEVLAVMSKPLHKTDDPNQ